MKKLLTMFGIFFVLQGAAAADLIELTDKGFYTWEDGKLKADSHLYKVAYELDENRGTLTTLLSTEINSGKTSEGGGEYHLMGGGKTGTGPMTRKFFYVDDWGGAYVISLNDDGTFLYTQMIDTYVNIAQGTWEPKQEQAEAGKLPAPSKQEGR